MHKAELADVSFTFGLEDHCICSIYGLPLVAWKKISHTDVN